MRGTVARRIRKEVYGDFSTREREYRVKWYTKIISVFKDSAKKEKEKKEIKTGTIRAFGRRRTYQDAKKFYKRGEEYRTT